MCINWQLFLVHLAGTIINTHLLGLTSENRINAIVIDDTFYGKLRSKCVELLATVHDHAGKGSKFKKGFRMLTLGWTDGNTFIPLIFSLLSSEDKKNRYCEMKDGLDKRSIAYKRKKQAITKAPVVMLEMLRTVVKSGIQAKHVSFDSWFSYPATIMEIFELKLHTIARLKIHQKSNTWLMGKRKRLMQ
jgi:hypothetical protein